MMTDDAINEIVHRLAGIVAKEAQWGEDEVVAICLGLTCHMANCLKISRQDMHKMMDMLFDQDEVVH